MPEHRQDFPVAYRLPTDAAAGIHATAQIDTPLLDSGSPRRRLAVVVLVLGVFGSGLAAGLPSGAAQALRGEDCRPGGVVDVVGDVRQEEDLVC